MSKLYVAANMPEHDQLNIQVGHGGRFGAGTIYPCAVSGVSLTDYSQNPQQKGWGAHCTGPFSTVTASNGVKVTVDSRIAELTGLLFNATIADGYAIRQADTGAYNCLAAETLVMTPDGDVPISELSGTTARLLTRSKQGGPGRWVDAPVKSYGVQSLLRVVLSRHGVEREVYATPGHRWLLDEPDRKNQERTTVELCSGHRLASVYPQSVASRVGVSSVGAAHGIVFGDGTVTRDEGRVLLCGEKNLELLKYFPEPHVKTYEAGLLVGQLPKSWKQFPSMTEGSSYLYGFLAGYFAADGDVTKVGTPRLSSANLDHLETVRMICTKLGIATTAPTTVKREGIDGEVRPMHSMTLSGRTLSDDFFLVSAHRRRFQAAPKRYAPARWSVVSVEETDREETVYCAEVPGTESFALADNLLTGNCRYIAGTTVWSNHAWGLAIDINWNTNPQHSPLTTDEPTWMRQMWNRYGFAWGGNYNSPTVPDAMHHEFMGTPAQAVAATNLARSELGGGPPPPPPPTGGVLPAAKTSPVTGNVEVPGFDCSYTKPGWVEMHDAGYTFVIGYVSPTPSKNLTADNIRDYNSYGGMGVGLVWESTASRALTGGSAGGTADGQAAEAQANALGYPVGAVIFFSVDVDTTSANYPAIQAYANAFNAATRRPVGIYGEADVIDHFVTPGVQPVRYGWQTAAWSGGRLSAKANLYQRVGHPGWPVPSDTASTAFDEDVAISYVPLAGWL